jgi:short-subunit dehydrogenase
MRFHGAAGYTQKTEDRTFYSTSSVFNQLEGYSSSYVGTKFAIEGISASLRRELLVYGIDVIVIAPHSTNTPFLDKVEAQDISMHDNTPYQRPGELVLDFIVRDGRKG